MDILSPASSASRSEGRHASEADTGPQLPAG